MQKGLDGASALWYKETMKTPRNPIAKEMATNPGNYRTRVVRPRKGKGAYRRERVVE